MPIVTEESPPKRRRAHGWAPALAAVVLLLLVGPFAWSWFEPVAVQAGPYRLVFGAMYGNVSSLGPGWHRSRDSLQVVVELPGRSGLYDVLWLGPRKRNGPTPGSPAAGRTAR